MPKAFTAWTVLPHDPIDKLGHNLWRVRGTMPDGNVQRQMVLARLADGRIIVHNAIALSDEEMRAIEAWGTPSAIFVPNGYHRQDALIWKQRYPAAKVIAPSGAKKRVGKLVPVDAVTEEAPKDDHVKLIALDGLPGESVMEVRTGEDTTLVFCDAVLNLPKVGGPVGFMLAPTGKVSAPRIQRWFMVKDKRAFAAHLDRLAATTGLRRVLVGHGKPVTDDPPGALRQVARQLRGD